MTLQTMPLHLARDGLSSPVAAGRSHFRPEGGAQVLALVRKAADGTVARQDVLPVAFVPQVKPHGGGAPLPRGPARMPCCHA